MSVYSSWRESSVLSVCESSNQGTSIYRGTSIASDAPLDDDPDVRKAKKLFYAVPKLKTQTDDQLTLFDSKTMHFRDWKNKFERIVSEREIGDEPTKKELLLKSLPSETLTIVPTLFRRYEEPLDKDVDVILSKLSTHYEKIDGKNKVRARIQFFSTRQNENNFYAFANSLKEQTFACDFGEFEGDALVVAFVGGIDNSVLRRHLLEKQLWLTSLVEAVELAIKFQEVLPP